MKINAMNKKLNSSLFSLLIVSGCIFLSQNVKAINVCAPQGLGNQAAADKFCPETCTKAGYNWYGAWDGKTKEQCTADDKVQTPNIYGSVCGCTPYKCANVSLKYTPDYEGPAYSMTYDDCLQGKQSVQDPSAKSRLAKVGSNIDLVAYFKNYFNATVPEKGLNLVCSKSGSGASFKSGCTPTN